MKKRMKLRWLVLALLILLFTSIPAVAALYTIDYDKGNYRSSVADSFRIDNFDLINSATLSITIAAKTNFCMGSYYCWNYDNIVDVTADSNLVLDNRLLSNDFETINIDLDDSTIASMLADHTLDFSIEGQIANWSCNCGAYGNSTSRFYLDKVELNVLETNRLACPTPTVPIPGSAWMLGSGLLGLISIPKKRMKV